MSNVHDLIDDLVIDGPSLENASLKAVICQVQFPRQLRLGDDEVRPIQKALKHRYPLFSEEQTVEVVVEEAPSPKAFFPSAGGRRRIFRFSDTDGGWTATIGSQAITLETTKFGGLRDLLVRWVELANTAAEALELTTQTRLGLRYINEVDCPDPRGEDLSDWVRDELVALFRVQPGREHLRRFVSQAQFRQDDGSGCDMRHGFAPSGGDEGRTVFLLDLDCFHGEAAQFDPKDQIRNLGSLNEYASGFIYWALPRHGWRDPEAKPSGRQVSSDAFVVTTNFDATVESAHVELNRGLYVEGEIDCDEPPPEPLDAGDGQGGPEPLWVTLRSMREAIDISVADLARMVGLRRRQFYNLLSGDSTSTETEVRIRRVAAVVKHLATATDGGPQAMRDAVLTPIGPNAVSLFEVAGTGDGQLLTAVADELLARIEARGLRRTHRAIPRSVPEGVANQRRRLVREALSDAPSRQPKGKGAGDDRGR